MSLTPDPNDKRAFKRVGRQFVTYVAMGVNKEALQWNLATMQDLSAGGAELIFDQEVQEGDLISIKINFFDHLIECHGKIMRLKSVPNKPQLCAGVMFLSMSDADRWFIERHCRYSED